MFTNEVDLIVLEAVLTGIVPGAREKRVMKDMVAKGDLCVNQGQVESGDFPKYALVLFISCYSSYPDILIMTTSCFPQSG